MIAVSGATGELGGRVARGLAALGAPQRLIVRDPSRAPRLAHTEVVGVPSYADGAAFRDALRGVDTLFLISARESIDRLEQHFSVITAALDAGVERIVYTSFLGAAPDATFTFARDHFHTEHRILATGIRSTFLRDSLYLDAIPFLAGDDGVIRGPAGDGRVAAVARDDVADVAVAVLTSDGHDGKTYDLTGPEAFTLGEAAAELSRAWRRPVTFENETLEEARASRAGSGAADWEIEGWVSSYAAIASGELDVVSDAVERIAGHRPISLAELLARP
jgi:NAD(P)H dehydrogenase (quinone)